MDLSDCERIRRALGRQVESVTRRFARTPANREVYAFAVGCDPENGHLALALNAVADLPGGEEGREGPDRDLAKWGFGELAWNPPDFAHGWGLSLALRRACACYRCVTASWRENPEDWDRPEAVADAERFADQAVLALRDSEQAFARLSRTPLFCAYVHLRDASRERQVALARRTVPEESFDRAFPEVRLREWELERVRGLPAEERARYWLGALLVCFSLQ